MKARLVRYGSSTVAGSQSSVQYWTTPTRSTITSTNVSTRLIGSSAVYVTASGWTPSIINSDDNVVVVYQDKKKLVLGETFTIELPDGAVFKLETDGSYTIDDTNAARIYKANNFREFNPYLNASDLLEEFIDYIASIGGVNQKQFLELPIEVFIHWLVVRAAELDGDPADYAVVIEHKSITKRKKKTNKCRCCGKFIPDRILAIGPFCNRLHMVKYAERLGIDF